MPRLRRIVAVLSVLIPTVWAASPAPAITFPVPSGYTIAGRHDMSPYMTHVVYKSSNPKRVVNVVFLRRGGAERFRMVVSNNLIAGPNPRTETLSSMCRRVQCKIAVNGDFFSRETGQPAGGIALGDGSPARTPPSNRYHFVQDWNNGVGVQKVPMPIDLYVTYPAKVPAEQRVWLHSLNTDRPTGRAVLYTPRWGPRTEQSGGFELVLRVGDLPVRMDRYHPVTILRGSSGGNNVIPSDGVVISGAGDQATRLAKIWSDIQAGEAQVSARLLLDSQPNLRSFMGGTPALLLGGRAAYTNEGCFTTCRNPHTMIGRNGGSTAIIAQIDGRQSHSVGFTIPEAAAFMKAIGATDALNLDGGGSSEFVKNGNVNSRPSDGRERPLASAITIV